MAGGAEKPMQLIDGQDSGGRIVNRGGKCFQGDVDQNAKGEERILLQGTFGTKDNGPKKSLITYPGGVAMKVKKGLVAADKISDLRDQLDDPPCLVGLRQERVAVDCEHNFRSPGMDHGPLDVGLGPLNQRT